MTIAGRHPAQAEDRRTAGAAVPTERPLAVVRLGPLMHEVHFAFRFYEHADPEAQNFEIRMSQGKEDGFVPDMWTAFYRSEWAAIKAAVDAGIEMAERKYAEQHIEEAMAQGMPHLHFEIVQGPRGEPPDAKPKKGPPRA